MARLRRLTLWRLAVPAAILLSAALLPLRARAQDVPPLPAEEQPNLVPISGALAVAAGGRHTCAINSSGGVLCWGRDDVGQVGDGSNTSDKLSPVTVVGLSSGFKAITAGFSHSCALSTGGGVKCWGGGSFGQLGHDLTPSRQATPVDVTGLASGVAAIAAGDRHTCALTTGGGVLCWGSDALGQLGNGPVETGDKRTPVAVVGLASGVTRIAAGGDHTCALTTSGAVLCWGSDFFGQLGNDSDTTDSESPVAVVGLGSGVLGISAGRNHSCAVRAAGLICWGDDSRGQLGNGAVAGIQPLPVAVAGAGAGASAVEAGHNQSCSIYAGALRCWGFDEQGQVGDGDNNSNKPAPVAVIGLGSGVAQVSGGDTHTCARTTGGVLYCWGDNLFGQLGDGTTRRLNQPIPDVPQRVYLPTVRK